MRSRFGPSTSTISYTAELGSPGCESSAASFTPAVEVPQCTWRLAKAFRSSLVKSALESTSTSLPALKVPVPNQAGASCSTGFAQAR